MANYKGNVGFLFTKMFFKGSEYPGRMFPNMKRHNKTLCEEVFLSDLTKLEQVGPRGFDLVTTYPGLLLGSGYPHDIHGEEGLKLGFYFDHTTGLPCIPGSSVKGVLRSAFEKVDGKYILYILEEIKAGERNLLKEKNLEGFQKLTASQKTIAGWLKIIFDGINEDGKELPATKKDVFFDAYPVESDNQNSKILATDYITPHKEPLKNPNPIQFLKVLPQVKFKFDFRLTDNGLGVPLKNELFRQILLDLGIGAKTNVGYGQFTDKMVRINQQDTQRPIRSKPERWEETIPENAREALHSNTEFEGSIVKIAGDYCYIDFEVSRKKCSIRKKYTAIRDKDSKKLTAISQINANDVVRIVVKNDYHLGSNLNCQVLLKK